jgi:hypothetical protein
MSGLSNNCAFFPTYPRLISTADASKAGPTASRHAAIHRRLSAFLGCKPQNNIDDDGNHKFKSSSGLAVLSMATEVPPPLLISALTVSVCC